MPVRSLVNADGEMLLVPRSGRLLVRTECGPLDARPGEIVLIPRGMRFAVDPGDRASGYVCENYGANLRLPERGLVGSDGFANTRDFMAPTAAFHDPTGTPANDQVPFWIRAPSTYLLAPFTPIKRSLGRAPRNRGAS